MRTEHRHSHSATPRTGKASSHEAVRPVDTTLWRAEDDPWQPPIRQLLRDQVREWKQEAERIKHRPA